ncbi:sulfotransferase [Singulisphaera sp. Ch08]|uniref:Sulfotransferase n=1 Tax=Singulisphaera sp. Ch08 TaxID=3120278 RepID=A0AAU7CRL3_9BACT
MIALAISLADQNEKREAVRVLDRAVEHLPQAPYAYLKLAGLRQFKQPDDPRVEYMVQLANQGSLPRSELAMLHSALGEIFELFEDYDRAFYHYRSMNELSIRTFSLAQLRSDVDAVIGISTQELLIEKSRLSAPKAGENLLFVVGMPRSGSTLIEQILASHPHVHAVGESRALTRVSRRLPDRVGRRMGYPACVTHLDRATVAWASNFYLEEISAPAHDGLMIVDKTLDNHMELGLISILFPAAKIIHCRRNPLDTCISCYFQNFYMLRFAGSLGTIGMVYREYERMMAHWRAALPGSLYEVEYEAMVSNPYESTRRLLDACGLSWSPKCLDFHRTKRVIGTSSVDQVKRPIYTHSVARWKRYEQHIGQLLEIFPEQVRASGSPGLPRG